MKEVSIFFNVIVFSIFIPSCQARPIKKDVRSEGSDVSSLIRGLEKSEGLKNEFIRVACENGSSNLKEGLKEKLGPEIVPGLKHFIIALNKWTKNRLLITEKLKTFKSTWILNECSTVIPESNRYYREWELQKHLLNNYSVSFLPTSHFQGLSSDQIEKKMKFLDGIQLENKSLLLEGFEFHEQIPCERVLQYALKKRSMLKSSEHTYMLHHAFWNGVPIIGADNQRLEEADFKVLEAGDKKKMTFLQAHRILGRVLDENKLDASIEQAMKLAHLEMTVAEFKSFYKELNKRDVPRFVNQIRMDFAPVEYQNLGTNRLVDALLEPPRNKALLSAIEFTNTHLGESIVIYGAAHYGIIRDELLILSRDHLKPAYCELLK